MSIKWESLVTDWDPDHPERAGRISLHRLRKFSTIVAFWLGCLVAIVAALVEVFGKAQVPTSMILILVGALVAPIMGSQVSDAIFETRITGKIRAGEAPGRRSSDTGSAVAAGDKQDP